ncbi:hypothetical protein ACSLBF_01940 [Pseudoalteromonas sp. T1lg65]|uniref:hypothetical protein n=1 Tax=Pseudoalteromonas sp. T1lg65 TaxID=2077101 RepID=UPI003F791EA6
MSLLIVILGLSLPHQYHLSRTVLLNYPQSDTRLTPLRIDHWPQLFNWNEGQAIALQEISSERYVGASTIIKHQWGEAELTITSILDNELQLVIHISPEHFINVSIKVDNENELRHLIISLDGTVNTPIIGGYLALFVKQYLLQQLDSALNHMNTLYKLQARNGS